MYLAGNTPVEGRRVDEDGKIGLAPVGFRNQVPVETEDLWQAAENLGDTDDRQISRIDNGVAAGGAHAISADPEKFKRTKCPARAGALVGDSRPRLSGATAQSIYELRPVHFPGGFAG